jgi:hypothetical protein
MKKPFDGAKARYEDAQDKLNELRRRHLKYPNGQPMFAPDGMMLDENGNRSIFDDVDAEDCP